MSPNPLRAFAFGLALSLSLPGLALADVATDLGSEIVETLRARGYAILENKTTWLGRQRVIAVKDGTKRELVFIPGTGEILRDYAVRTSDGTRDSGPIGGVAAMSGGVGTGTTRSASEGVVSAPGLSVGDPIGVGAAETGPGVISD